MTLITDNLIHNNDMYVEPIKRFVSATPGEQRSMNIKLVECSVLDPDRFAHFQGVWWKIEGTR